MNPEQNLEREYKFDVPESFELPDLESVAGPVAELDAQRFVTTYFDSEDYSLWARRITLRHRAEDGATGKWTLKIPAEAGEGGQPGRAGDVARSELSWKAPISQVPPEAVVESGVEGELQTVVTMAAERRRLQLGDWGEIDDDVVTVTSGPRTGLRFRQVELELLGPADPAAVDAVVDRLGRAGATPGGGVKFAKAAGLE